MNIEQACNLLGINIGASDEEVKKAFRIKAAQYHPDKNKEPNAETMFKTINEAYQFLSTNGTTPKQQPAFHFNSGVFDINEMINQHFQSVFINNVHAMHSQITPIIVSVDVPFELSVTGGKKQITYERTVPCDQCGKNTNEKCTKCNGTKIISSVSTVEIQIPPGVESMMRLMIKNMGHFSNGRYGVVYCNINVIKDSEMFLDGPNVISAVNLTLLEALKGIKKKVRTVKGEKTLTFQPLVKNNDTIQVSGFGVPPFGSHIFQVKVQYPDDVSKLIEVLETQQNNTEEISGQQNKE